MVGEGGDQVGEVEAKRVGAPVGAMGGTAVRLKSETLYTGPSFTDAVGEVVVVALEGGDT